MIVHEKYKKLQNNKIGQGRHNFIFVLNEKLRFFSRAASLCLTKIYIIPSVKKPVLFLCVFVFNEETLTPRGQLENVKQG